MILDTSDLWSSVDRSDNDPYIALKPDGTAHAQGIHGASHTSSAACSGGELDDILAPPGSLGRYRRSFVNHGSVQWLGCTVVVADNRGPKRKQSRRRTNRYPDCNPCQRGKFRPGRSVLPLR